MKEMSYRDALREALLEEMRRDERVFIIGEEVGRYGGAYGVTRGLFQEFGARRVVDSPISEAGIVGLGVGAAITGLRPIVELMYVDFVGLAMDQIANQMAKFRYMTGGQLTIPMVLRTQGGTGRSAGAQHSQSLESWLVHVPGLRVVMPSNARDAKGLLKTAVRCNDPVVFIEHKGLYSAKGEVPEDEYTIALGKAAVLRQGKDATILSYSAMVHVAMKAADALGSEGIEAEVIDLRTLNPLDMQTIIASAGKTGRVAVVSEAHKTLGMGAELSALISEQCFEQLKAPVLRIAASDTPVPASILEKMSVPGEDSVVQGVRHLVSGE
ncbi:MAG: alpha-ketoacid dehydrogenase subunit beta [Spirochaetales bacterium]|nr:alpha-ketoacid dehydrogenase subunit beta [Spirochaetales bacterium]